MPLEAIILLAVALVSAALMGMAIQRGATCMVAAIDQAVSERRFAKLGALAEAALWVGGMIAVAGLLGVFEPAPARVPVTVLTVVGGILLGLGAWINQACVFGAVARIGAGQWAWLATPVGFFAGCLVPLPVPAVGGHAAPGLVVTALTATVFAAVLLWRLLEAGRAPSLRAHLWHPYRATLVIAVTFFTAMLSAGMWAYTDALSALARSAGRVDPHLALRSVMVVALLGGTVFGGFIAGKLRRERPSPTAVVRCFAGGALMGAGAMLVPGSNDGLIMVGLPLLQPHAWVAVGTMALVIAAAAAASARARPGDASAAGNAALMDGRRGR